MKNQFKLLTLGTLSLIAASCGNKVTMPDPGTPVFTQFTYTGKDVVYEKNTNHRTISTDPYSGWSLLLAHQRQRGQRGTGR